MIELPTGLSAELVPLSWLLGVWEGTGVVEYSVGESIERHEFRQRVSFSHDGLPHLNYSSSTWLVGVAPAPDAGDAESAVGFDPTPLATETGYWRLSRPLSAADPGPGLLPGVGQRPYSTASDVETLRNSAEGFDIELSLVHPGGVSEVYLGQVKGPRIQLATDAVIRTDGSKSYSAATRLYGLVERDLLWTWDIAALGQDLRTHASGRLARLE
ncbi:FABP family protein [Planctomonas psychrotolerans]|uniref:FABP family protein n=1 Tax=Planctomonas psychrotolerans TaxID=2528712 RepID=UPI0012387297|nr:FABP family protein [Planctomonas psychrotolerans]